nr:ABC transporter ATP-binding protein [Lactococcus termiticola]
MLKNISLEIKEGKTTAIIGVNGSGKSTLLRSLGRLNKYEGEVLYQDQELGRLSQREIARHLALLPQKTETPTDITVYDLIALGRFPHQGLMQQRLSKEDEDFLEQIMWDTETWELRDEKLESLSGGQRQRVFISMILAQDTDLILLDEPTTYLDMVHQLEILTLLKSFAEKLGKTVVYVIHDLNHVARFADELLVLKEGQLVASGPVTEVFTEKLIQDCFGLRVRLGEDTFTGHRMILGIQNV